MHAHGSHYFDLGSGNGTYNATENEKRFAGGYTPARRDTTILHRYATSGQVETTSGWRAWRIAVTEDTVGAWMMHCHVLAHMVSSPSLLSPPLFLFFSFLLFLFGVLTVGVNAGNGHANSVGLRQ